MKHAWTRLRTVVLVSLAGAVPAGADVIADWNICSQPIIATGRSTIQFGAGPSTQLDLALVHLAMHDAVQAYDKRFETYAGTVEAGSGRRRRLPPEPPIRFSRSGSRRSRAPSTRATC